MAILRPKVGAVFKLTTKEQKIVAFLVGALLLGTGVKHWRANNSIAPVGLVSVTTDKGSR